MATASLDTAGVGEVDMGDELEDDEEAEVVAIPYRDRSLSEI